MFSCEISILVFHTSVIRPSVPQHCVSNTDAYLTFEPSELLLFYYCFSSVVGPFTLASELTVISVNSYLHEIHPDRGDGRDGRLKVLKNLCELIVSVPAQLV